MTDHSVTHGSFRIERTYDARPARVFRAFADPVAKAAWFSGDDGQWEELERTSDFRVGGVERLASRWLSAGVVSRFACTYYDIVENNRIVYAYEMHLDDRKISVSLATIEFRPEGAGTKLVMTEHGAFLDGFDGAAGREEGTNALLDRLGVALQSELVG